jgi:hypothetical protein
MGVRYSLQSRNPQPIRSRSRNIEATLASSGRITEGKGRFIHAAGRRKIVHPLQPGIVDEAIQIRNL